MTTPPRPSNPPHSSHAASAIAGITTLLLTLVGWSSVPLFIKHFASSLDLWTSNGWRYGFSAVLWAPVLIVAAARRRIPVGLWRAAIIPSLFNALGQTAFAWSYYKVDPTTATFGLRTQIVFVAVGAYLLFPTERAVLRTPTAWVGIGAVLIGVAGTIFLAPGASDGAPTHAFGVFLSLSAGALFAGYGLSVRRFMHGFHPIVAFAAISQYTAAICLGLMLTLARSHHTGAWNAGADAWALSNIQFALLLLSAVIGIALGHVFYYIAIARLGVAVSSGVLQLQPFCVAIGAWLVFATPLTSGQLASGLLAVVGAAALLTVQWRVSREARAAAGQSLPPPTVDHSDMELAEPAAADCASDR